MNPYDFVRLVGNGPARGKVQMHDRFSGESGRIVCKITTRTPIFIPAYRQSGSTHARVHQSLSLIRDANRKPFIPGSSLKGVIRNVAEAAGNSCLVLPWRYDYERGQIEYSLSAPGFAACQDARNLCPTCRLFGMLMRGEHYLGNVAIQDAQLITEPKTERMTLAILGNPKPHHTAFYALQPVSRSPIMAGRKFYYHRPQGVLQANFQSDQNRTVEALLAPAEFTFVVNYQNVSAEDLKLLLFALTLWDDTCHKIGTGKPIGMGSVKIEITEIQRLDLRERYTRMGGGWQPILQGDELKQWLFDQTRAYTSGTADNLQDLHRILRWDAANPPDIKYPGRDWFTQNSTAPLSKAP